MCCIQYQVCPDQLAAVPAPAGMSIPAGFSFDTSRGAKAKQDGACDSSTNSVDYIGISESGNHGVVI